MTCKRGVSYLSDYTYFGRKTSTHGSNKQRDLQKILTFVLITFCFIVLMLSHVRLELNISLKLIFNKNNQSVKELPDENTKYILYWFDVTAFGWFGEGHSIFMTNKCPHVNCYFSYNTTLFGDDLGKFDSILFYGPYGAHSSMHKFYEPTVRHFHQKYIYFNPESSHNYAECTRYYDGFFNWTMTYRLDSDCPVRYFTIKDRKGNIIGPNKNVPWIQNMNEVDGNIIKNIRRKKKAAAWFASHCLTLSRREEVVNDLARALNEYNLTVDVFGACGGWRWSCERGAECSEMLERDYFFYLAFENSFAEDYITEKVLHGFNNTVVPIMYGAADYSRFLPPGSYIDLRTYGSMDDLARLMHTLMNNLTLYSQYFRWRSHYSYSDGYQNHYAEATCHLCGLLNDREKFSAVSVYKDFRNWWFPDYRNVCGRRLRRW